LAIELWDKIEGFAQYAFNKSHSAAYSLITFQTMYLKAHYPIEFYAASMTVLDDEKRQLLIDDAKMWDIRVEPPEINTSTDRFEILDEKTIVAPFSVLKGLSEKGSQAIMKARADAPFLSMKDFISRVPARTCNISVRAKLEEIGSFVRITPGSLPVAHPSRKPHQIEFCPSIMSGGVSVTRSIPADKLTRAALVEVFKDMSEDQNSVFDDVIRVLPRHGKRAYFMAVSDGPTWSEDAEARFASGRSFATMEAIMDDVGIDVSRGYWTGLSKIAKPKSEKIWPDGFFRACEPYLDREVEITKTPIILTLGSSAMRKFAPGLKGSNLDHIGKIIYNKALDANIVIGFNPGMIVFDDQKAQMMHDVIHKVKEMMP
jgi:DNA polymerase-3 subunit alpha